MYLFNMCQININIGSTLVLRYPDYPAAILFMPNYVGQTAGLPVAGTSGSRAESPIRLAEQAGTGRSETCPTTK